jgi:5-methylcytosine-specific restriction endonuclease McrA
MNKPWLTPDGKKIWKTEAQYWSWLRGALRRLWSDYPLRKQWKASQLRKITQEEKDSKKYHPSTKNLGLCAYCNEWLAGSKLECDHVQASDGCTTKDTAESFLWHCGGGTGDEWVLACKPCHSTKTLSDKLGISFQDAVVEQKVIAICKQPAKQIDSWLDSHNISGYIKNPKSRRNAVRDVLMKQKEEKEDEKAVC